MNQVIFQNEKFIYKTDGNEKVLLDCTDYLSNKSRIPMHSIDGTGCTIPNLVDEEMILHSKKNQKDEWGNLQADEYKLILILLIKKLISCRYPFRICFIGEKDSILYYHLTRIAGIFNPDSLILSFSDKYRIEKNNIFPNDESSYCKIADVVAEYNSNILSERSFDITLIDGNTSFENPEHVVELAKRVTKEKGLIICLNVFQPLLGSVFTLLNREVDHYSFLPYIDIAAVNSGE